MTPKEIVLAEDRNLVYLRNPIATAKYKLTQIQQKVFLEMALMAKKSPDTLIYRLYINEFLKKIRANTNEKTAIKLQIAEMTHIPIVIDKTKSGGFVDATIFASVERFSDDPKEYVEIEISQKIKPYFIEFAEGEYFKYEIQNTRPLKSVYSIRMYLLLKSWQRIGKFSMTYQDLRKATGVDDDEYKLFGDFHKRVIKSAYDELREKTDLSFDYTLERARKKNPNSPVVRVNFKIFDNGNEPIEPPQPPQLLPLTIQVDAELLNLAHQIEKVDGQELATLVANFGRDRVHDVLTVAQQQAAKGIKIQSLIAYLYTAIKTNSGIGKARKQAEKRSSADVMKSHKEIETAIKRGLDDFKRRYSFELGNQALAQVKEAHRSKVIQEISKIPALKSVYMNGESWNEKALWDSLGHELNRKSEYEIILLFMESIGKPVIQENGFWKFKEQGYLSIVYL